MSKKVIDWLHSSEKTFNDAAFKKKKGKGKVVEPQSDEEDPEETNVDVTQVDLPKPEPKTKESMDEQFRFFLRHELEAIEKKNAEEREKMQRKISRLERPVFQLASQRNIEIDHEVSKELPITEEKPQPQALDMRSIWGKRR